MPLDHVKQYSKREPGSPQPSVRLAKVSSTTYWEFYPPNSSRRDEGNNDPVSKLAEFFQQVIGFIFGGHSCESGQVRYPICQVPWYWTVPFGRGFLKQFDSMGTMKLLSATAASKGPAAAAAVVTYRGRSADTLKKLLAVWIVGANAFHKTGLSKSQVSESDKPGMSCPANPSLMGLSTLYHLSCDRTY